MSPPWPAPVVRANRPLRARPSGLRPVRADGIGRRHPYHAPLPSTTGTAWQSAPPPSAARSLTSSRIAPGIAPTRPWRCPPAYAPRPSPPEGADQQRRPARRGPRARIAEQPARGVAIEALGPRWRACPSPLTLYRAPRPRTSGTRPAICPPSVRGSPCGASMTTLPAFPALAPPAAAVRTGPLWARPSGLRPVRVTDRLP